MNDENIDENTGESIINLDQDFAKFPNTINVAQLYHQFFQNVSGLFRTSTPTRAIEYFYNMLPPFLIVKDEEFSKQYKLIEEQYKNNRVRMYQLHHTELIRLLTRSGMIPKPDISLKIYSADAPESVDELYSDEELNVNNDENSTVLVERDD